MCAYIITKDKSELWNQTLNQILIHISLKSSFHLEYVDMYSLTH